MPHDWSRLPSFINDTMSWKYFYKGLFYWEDDKVFHILNCNLFDHFLCLVSPTVQTNTNKKLKMILIQRMKNYKYDNGY